jgi:hypothetical protein
VESLADLLRLCHSFATNRWTTRCKRWESGKDNKVKSWSQIGSDDPCRTSAGRGDPRLRSWLLYLMFRMLMFRMLMFRMLMFRMLMFRMLMFRMLMFRMLMFRVLMFRVGRAVHAPVPFKRSMADAPSTSRVEARSSLS